MTTTTSIHLGADASAAHIEQIFDYVPGCAEAVAEEFNEIAAEAGSAARLCIYTATALVPVDEIRDSDDEDGVDEDDGYYDDSDYEQFLALAIERVSCQITDGEFD